MNDRKVRRILCRGKHDLLERQFGKRRAGNQFVQGIDTP
jgi:hypothetical protein